MPKKTAEVEIHLQHANSFLKIAKYALMEGEAYVATTLAINSAIHSKDAICVFWFDTSKHSQDHSSASKELRRVPDLGKKLDLMFSRIASGKNDAEFAATFVSNSTAKQAVERAEVMLEIIQAQIFASSRN